MFPIALIKLPKKNLFQIFLRLWIVDMPRSQQFTTNLPGSSGFRQTNIYYIGTRSFGEKNFD